MVGFSMKGQVVLGYKTLNSSVIAVKSSQLL